MDLQNPPYIILEKSTPMGESLCHLVRLDVKIHFCLVSKTTKELILRWKKDRPVDISSEVKMPQFEISKIDPAKCQETFHIGKFILQTY